MLTAPPNVHTQISTSDTGSEICVKFSAFPPAQLRSNEQNEKYILYFSSNTCKANQRVNILIFVILGETKQTRRTNKKQKLSISILEPDSFGYGQGHLKLKPKQKEALQRSRLLKNCRSNCRITETSA